MRNAVTQVESCIADKPSPTVATACTATGIPELSPDVTISSAVNANGLYTLRRASASGGVFTIAKTGAGVYVRACDGTTKGCNGVSW